MPLQLRRGTEQERQDMTQPLAEGEPLFITDDNILYIGIRNNDGTFPLPKDLVSPTSYTDINARAAIVDMLEGGLHPDIIYNYTHATDTLDVELTLQAISQSIIPNVNATHDLGSDTNRFRNLYLSGSSLWVGDAHITANGNAINLPLGSTVNGVSLNSDTLNLPILNEEPVVNDGTIAVADGTNWNPTGSNSQTLVVKLLGQWIELAVG